MRSADSKRWALLAAAVFGYTLCFVVVCLFERSGLGLGRFLLLPVVLLALATDAWLGVSERSALWSSRKGRGEADALLRVSRLLTTCLDPRDSLVRVGQDEFGVPTSLSSGEEAGKLAATLESVLDQQGLDVTFGWSVAPQDGANALSLCQAADERRYARTLIRAARPHYSTA
jgi:Diguanylate cyclase, GGDEF domain